jgi:putative transposase
VPDVAKLLGIAESCL